MKLIHIALSAAMLAATVSAPALADDFDPAAEIAAAIEAGDLEKGAKVYKKCKGCHKIGEGAKNAVGPGLNTFFGKEIGMDPKFKYSKTLLAKKAEEGTVWTIENLDTFFKKPKAFIPKTKMGFAGLKKDADRTNLIAYLASMQVAE